MGLQEAWRVVEKCVAVAGFSVGEFAALVFSGVLDFTEALHAVKVRAAAMQEASQAVQSGMLSVIGKCQTRYNFACLQAREHCKSLGIENPVCEVASYLFPDGRVLAGHLEALQFLQRNSQNYHFRRTLMLPVSGAFHTSLMKPAVEPLSQVLKTMTFQNPLISVYCNIDGKRYRHAEQIQNLLVKQLVSPVKWEQTLHTVYERRRGAAFPKTYEVGPGKQLGSTLKACNAQAWKFYKHVDIAEVEEEPQETEES
ncbi:malonyl-CoA-acyl carrier protein transacylase, mitochondrial isoform X2 [Ambystoma mexicanum]|uniref:malonyl-CoA-acyl carrier protein transacylase, mitochondrial isoform X2 n=1 Tax=Ambystoma mexicanum TaxID=8296 RepID=UPI0037E847BE